MVMLVYLGVLPWTQAVFGVENSRPIGWTMVSK
jgi:hypothetical protein